MPENIFAHKFFNSMSEDQSKQGKLWVLLSALYFCAVYPALAQQSVERLRLDDALNRATQQNRNILIAKLDEQVAKAGYKQTNAVFMPQVNVSYTAFTTNNPLNAFGFKLQQQRISAMDFDPAGLNNPEDHPDFMTKFSVQQPLLNMDMLYARRAAAKQVALYRYKRMRTEEFVVWQVQQSYLQLQFSWDMKAVMEEALVTAQSARKFIKDRYDLGMLQQSDFLNTEVHLKTVETQLAEAQSNINNASDFLSVLMNRPAGSTYQPDTAVFADVPADEVVLPESRADIRAMESAVGAYNEMLKSERMNYLPRLNAFADYQLHDDRAFGFYGNGYLAGAQLSWDLFRGDLHQKVKSRRYERDKLAEELEQTKEQSRVEISKALRQLKDARYKINQQQEAVNQAMEALRITRNRHEQGLVSTTDLLMAQTQLSQQRLAYAQAVFEKNSALIYLEFLTKNHP